MDENLRLFIEKQKKAHPDWQFDGKIYDYPPLIDKSFYEEINLNQEQIKTEIFRCNQIIEINKINIEYLKKQLK